GAGSADEGTAVVAQSSVDLFIGLLQWRMAAPVEIRRERHVDQFLWVQSESAQLLRERGAALAHASQHLQGSDDGVARSMTIQAYQMPGAFSTQLPAALEHGFQHIAVAHGGPHETYAEFL